MSPVQCRAHYFGLSQPPFTIRQLRKTSHIRKKPRTIAKSKLCLHTVKTQVYKNKESQSH